MIQAERVNGLNAALVRPAGRYVLYWMQQAQRAECNHALEYAVAEGNRLRRPVVAAFGLTPNFPGANLRHYQFLLDGLAETRQALAQRGIRLVVVGQSPPELALCLAREAALLVTDVGYLRIQKQWRAIVGAGCPCRAVAVETDVVVPVAAASPHEEYTAATLRPKIHRQLAHFLVPLLPVIPRYDSLSLALEVQTVDDLSFVPDHFPVDGSVLPVPTLRGGRTAAQRLLRAFLETRLTDYDDRRNELAGDGGSGLSPYLHFGQLSPLEVALAAGRAAVAPPARDAFLEELIVRRELSMNYVHYNAQYDRYQGLPAWALASLARHAADARPYAYSVAELEQARTHDPYWNAAQTEMVATGRMQGYMRMYWGKKVLEWSPTPEKAFDILLYLNNKYEVDGRDANGFAGVAWCFGKHDRPWGERPVFGKIRYMNAAGLERKFDMTAYVAKISAMVRGNDRALGNQAE